MIKDVVDKWLYDVKLDLIKSYDSKGLRSSGRWANTLESFNQSNGDSYRIGMLGQKYSGAMESGRLPNKNQSPEAIRKWVGWAGSTIIAKWVEDKGLSLNPYAVAYKIAREGIKVPNSNNSGGVISDVVTRERMKQLAKSLSLKIIEDFKSEIIKNIK